MKSFKNFLLIIPVLSLLVCCIFCPITTQAAGLYSKYSVLIDADSGRILSGSNETTAVSMASTTKIMTLIIALENCDKNFVATTSAYAASMPDVQLNAVTGEQFIINDLYYSLMLESHNDSAVIIAENTAYYLLCKNPSLRSETPFINNYNYDSSVLSEINHEQSEILVHLFTGLMNEKADDILLSDTYYITPNGLDAEDNYSFHHTTAYDLAKTMAYCINNEDFLYITQTVSKTFSDTTGRYHYQLNNKNRILNPDEGIISGKTGFTNKAGYCMKLKLITSQHSIRERVTLPFLEQLTKQHTMLFLRICVHPRKTRILSLTPRSMRYLQFRTLSKLAVRIADTHGLLSNGKELVK